MEAQRLQSETHRAVDELVQGLALNMKETYQKMLDTFKKKAEGERTRLTDTHVTHFLEFFEAVSSLNVTRNESLEDAHERIMELLEEHGINTKAGLREKYENAAPVVAQALETTLEAIDEVMETRMIL